MALEPLFKMSIRNKDGDFYYANQDASGVWTVGTTSTPTYLRHLPKGWEDTKIRWERDQTYMGVFRSRANDNYGFAMDARAIIQHLANTYGVQAFGVLTIYMRQDTESYLGAMDFWRYEIFYQSELNFATYKDNYRMQITDIATLDSGLIRYLHAHGDTVYNIPIWYNAGTPIAPDWRPDGAEFVEHKGIKLMFNASFTSSASETDPLDYGSPSRHELYGWNLGDMTDGYHIIPPMTNYNIVQNNGTTTYIGNDILQPFLLQGNQSPGAANFASESSFHDVNHSQPYTRNNYALKNLLPNTDGYIDMYVSVKVKFQDNRVAGYAPSGTGKYMAFVVFDIDKNNDPQISGGRYVHPTEIYRIPLTDPSGDQHVDPINNVDTPAPIRLYYDRVYVIGMIYDRDGGVGGDGSVYFGITQLEVNFRSKFDGGASGIPVPAPSFPTSTFAGFRLYQLLNKVVANLNTTLTDGYGFPVPSPEPYLAVSDFLTDDTLAPVGDIVPYNLIWTSDYCIHDLAGRSYVSASFNQLFDFCRKQLGCAVAIEAGAIRLENLRRFFDDSTMILDLGDNVADLEVEILTTGAGANLKLGYSRAENNGDFGVTAFNTELFFSTPLSALRDTIDWQETSVVTEMHAIEKTRAQKVTQPIGETFVPASPSGNNSAVVVYCDSERNSYESGVAAPTGVGSYYVRAYKVKMYTDAQSTDPSAATAPYIYGLYWPDTAINVPLSPCRALQRDTGAYLHSVIDILTDADYLTFRNTYVMQFNNEVLALSGMESNLDVGGASDPITEFKDVQIGSLPAALFRPRLIRVTTKTPVNMYGIINTNARGYIRCFWTIPTGERKEFKGFIWSIEQAAGNNSATILELLATPDMTF